MYNKSHAKKLAQYLNRIYISLGFVFLTTSLGILGFMFFEGYNTIEAFYMTVITLSTVGYTEVRPLSDAGRIFASILIITNIGVFAYALSVLSSYIVDGNWKYLWQEYKMQRKINKLNNHSILCGYGRYGREVSKHLEARNTPFVIIESDEAVIQELQLETDYLYIDGDATHDEVLMEAGIGRASSLITTLPDDADNVYVVLSARQLHPSLRIISRALDHKSEVKLKLAGADEVITLEYIGGFYMATLIGKPDVVEFFRVLSNESGTNLSIEEIDFTQLPKSYLNKTIKELGIRENTGANVIGIKTEAGEYLVNPSPNEQIQEGMRLIVLGNQQQILQFKHFWSQFRNNGMKIVEE